MDKNKKLLRVIMVVSVIVPVLVAILLLSPFKLDLDVSWVKYLPTFNAMINSATCVLLIVALIMAKQNNIEWHKRIMLTCFVFGVLFLVSYILYHSSMPSVKFGDINGDSILQESELQAVGANRLIYIILLLSHILFSIVVVPLVLMAFYYALTDNISRHKKIVKYTWPIWFYVSVTGPIVYLMISPYYPY